MPAHAAPGDGHWDRQFGTPGTASRNFALRFNENSLYTGGTSVAAGQIATNTVVNVFDGTQWSTLGEITGGLTVLFGFAFLGKDLYVGDNVPALNVAKWNGSVWSALGAGLKGPPDSGAVGALASLGTDLYAFGGFTNAGGITARGLARWNGANWSSFGSLNGAGTRAISNAGSIYVCGDYNIANFDTSSNVIGNHVIRWDGSNWHGLPGKPSNGTHLFVQAVGTGNDGIYVGGFFNAVGTTIARRIGRWDGTNWFALGGGVDGLYKGNSLAVRAIKPRNNEVFVGGGFVSAGGATANNIDPPHNSNSISVTAPSEALVTALAYFASTPRL